MAGAQRLSEKSITVLCLIADGRSYTQIVDSNVDITYRDIFVAAEEALEALKAPEASSEWDKRMARIKQEYPRAYERWTDMEDTELTGMCQKGSTVAEIADHLGRQPSAIRARITKLGLEAGTR